VEDGFELVEDQNRHLGLGLFEENGRLEKLPEASLFANDAPYFLIVTGLLARRACFSSD